MDIFAKVLQGPYAYLLILQVLIVSGLCLTLIYLILLRLREVPAGSDLSAERDATVGQVTIVANRPETLASVAMEAPLLPDLNALAAIEPAPPPPPVAVPVTPPMTSDVPAPTLASPPPSAAPVAEPPAVAVDTRQLNALEQEAAAARDKVRYLESKLLEYEILQEEIGTLSILKVENEKLRQELMAAKQGRPVAPAAAPPVASAPAAPAPPATAAADSPIPPALKSAADAAAELLAGAEPKTMTEPPPTDVTPGAVPQSQLDNLMSQIDTLTKK